MKKISCTHKMSNKKVFKEIGDRGTILTITKRKRYLLLSWLRRYYSMRLRLWLRGDKKKRKIRKQIP